MTRRPATRCWLCLLPLVPAALAGAAEPTLSATNGRQILSNGLVDLAFDGQTGRLLAYGRTRGALVAGGRPAELQLSDGAWQSFGGARLVGCRLAAEAARPGPWIVGAPAGGSPGGSVLALTWDGGDWQRIERWRLWADSTVVARTVEWVWHGQAPVTVRATRFELNGCRVGGANDCELVLPRTFPVAVRPFGQFQPGRGHNLEGGSTTNRLVVVRNAAERQSLLVMVAADAEHGWGQAFEQRGAADVQHVIAAQLVVPPGGRFEVGAQLLGLGGAEPGEVVERAWEMFDRAGLKSCARPVKELDEGAIYSAHPGGTIGSNFRDCGGFTAFARRLPRLKQMGFSIVWLLPFWKGPVYAPILYDQLDASLGTEADLKALVDQAHAHGLKVLGDLVPHGPREEGGLEQQHPDWVTRNPDGSIFYMWGCLQCDYAHPGWQQYMAEHAVDWMRRVGLDGYRVDCAGGGPPNWRPAPGLRPSMSSAYGARKLLATVRAAMLKCNPNALLVMEGTSPEMAESGDVVYDFPWAYDVLPKSLSMPPGEWLAAARQWLWWQKAWYPRGTRFMRYCESHDMSSATLRYGPTRHRSLLGLNGQIDGVPMVVDGEEVGVADAFTSWRPRALPGATSATVGPDALWQRLDAAPGTPSAAPAPPATRPRVVVTADLVTVTDAGYVLQLDPRRGGAIAGSRSAGADAIRGSSFAEGRRKLFIGSPPLDLFAVPAQVSVSEEGSAQVVRFQSQVGTPPRLGVVRTYRCLADGQVQVSTELTGLADGVEQVSSILTEAIRVTGAGDWSVETTEGRLQERGGVERAESAQSWRYLYPPAARWDSRLLPLAGAVTAGGVRFAGFDASAADWCQSVRLTAAGLEIRWLDGRPTSLAKGSSVTLRYVLWPGPGGVVAAKPADPRLHTEAGSYVFENRHYRLALGRADGGGLRELRRRVGQGWGPNLVSGLDTYTDVGLYGDSHDPAGRAHRTNARSRGDLEAALRVRHEGSDLVLCFEGAMRSGSNDSLDVQRPLTWYRHEYRLNDTPTIRLALGVRPHGSLPREPVTAFVSHTLTLPDTRAWRAAAGDGAAGADFPAKFTDRLWQSRDHRGLAADGLEFAGRGGRLCVRVTGGDALQNVFVLGGGGQGMLFLAPFDLQAAPIAPRWYQTLLTLEAKE